MFFFVTLILRISISILEELHLELFTLVDLSPMTLTYVVTTLSDLQQILTIARFSLKS